MAAVGMSLGAPADLHSDLHGHLHATCVAPALKLDRAVSGVLAAVEAEKSAQPLPASNYLCAVLGA